MGSPSETLDRIARSREAVFATDPGDRVILWNKRCETLLGRTARAVLGKKCYEVLGGRDEYGNTYCHQSCPVAFQARTQTHTPVNRFILKIDVGKGQRAFWVSMFTIPSHHPALATIVHVLRDRVKESLLEKHLVGEAAIREPLWPMTTGFGESIVLTKREDEVLHCLSEGMSTTSMSSKLLISSVTVRNHVASILQKLDVHTKLAAVAFAHQHHLI
jgi:DNA-binding CsgD family transcriptional regulator